MGPRDIVLYLLHVVWVVKLLRPHLMSGLLQQYLVNHFLIDLNLIVHAHVVHLLVILQLSRSSFIQVVLPSSLYTRLSSIEIDLLRDI